MRTTVVALITLALAGCSYSEPGVGEQALVSAVGDTPLDAGTVQETGPDKSDTGITPPTDPPDVGMDASMSPEAGKVGEAGTSPTPEAGDPPDAWELTPDVGVENCCAACGSAFSQCMTTCLHLQNEATCTPYCTGQITPIYSCIGTCSPSTGCP